MTTRASQRFMTFPSGAPFDAGGRFNRLFALSLDTGIRLARGCRRMRPRMLLAALLLVATSSATAAEDSQRIEGLSPRFIATISRSAATADKSSWTCPRSVVSPPRSPRVSALRSSGRWRLAARHFTPFVWSRRPKRQ